MSTIVRGQLLSAAVVRIHRMRCHLSLCSSGFTGRPVLVSMNSQSLSVGGAGKFHHAKFLSGLPGGEFFATSSFRVLRVDHLMQGGGFGQLEQLFDAGQEFVVHQRAWQWYLMQNAVLDRPAVASLVSRRHP